MYFLLFIKLGQAFPIRAILSDYLKYECEFSNGDRFQKAFSQVAKRYLTPPCSTVDVERLFSDAGDIYCDDRMSLKAPKVERILFIHQNVKHCNFEYLSKIDVQ